eukprot:scaffold22606_cov138-Cylindrotheca_fusiformis.AAC.1
MDLRKRLKRVLLQWGGTHSFHNFTNWNAQYNKDDCENDETKRGSSGHFRHILRCHVEDVIQHDNKMDFVVISIKGQSFVYHQIRKMMGATIGIMNQSLPEDFITKAFSEKETGIDVPLAPAEGLIMVEAIYSKYCSKQKIEPIGLGTKLLYREDRNRSTHQEQQTAWKAAAAQLQQDTAETRSIIPYPVAKGIGVARVDFKRSDLRASSAVGIAERVETFPPTDITKNNNNKKEAKTSSATMRIEGRHIES